MITHQELLTIAKLMFYKPTPGLCRGFSGMWMQAVCSNDLETFNKRLELLSSYSSVPEQLLTDISKAQASAKKFGREYLSDDENILLELPAFFDGVALYLDPSSYSEFFDKQLSHMQVSEIAPFLLTDKLKEVGGLYRNFYETDQYDIGKLAKYFKKLSTKLRDRPDVAIILDTVAHSVGVRVVGKDKFELFDTNALFVKNHQFSSDELAIAFFYIFSFSQTKTLKYPEYGQQELKDPCLILKSEIYTAKNVKLLKKKIKSLRSTDPLDYLVAEKGETVFTHAVLYNEINTLLRLDPKHINPNEKLCTGDPAFVYACAAGYKKIVKFLLQSPDVDVNALDMYGMTALQTAVLNNDTDMAVILLDAKADCNKFKQGTRPLLHEAILSSDIYLIDKMLEAEVDCNLRDSNGNTSLHSAISLGRKEITQALIAHGADCSLLDQDGNSSLHLATLLLRNDIVETIIGRSADYKKLIDLNMYNADGNTCLHLAALLGRMDIARTLIAHGADCSIKSKSDSTPLVLACRNKQVDVAHFLLDQTKFSQDDFKLSSQTYKAIARSDISIQKHFLKTVLIQYIQEQKPKAGTFDWLNPRSKKIAAATALLMNLSGEEVDLKAHKTTLNKEDLSPIYNMYRALLNQDANPTAAIREEIQTLRQEQEGIKGPTKSR